MSPGGDRFGGEGFYVLDEPEAALSVSGALALLAIVVRATRAGAQFVIATHSPILLACPDGGAQRLVFPRDTVLLHGEPAVGRRVAHGPREARGPSRRAGAWAAGRSPRPCS